jgi:hypothetical protein
MMTRGFSRLALATAAVALISGCGGLKPQPLEFNVIGYSAEFKQGYADGCESARSRLSRNN